MENLKNLEKSRQKNPNEYTCELCDFNTVNKKDFNKHLATDKHKSRQENPKSRQENPKEYSCDLCDYITSEVYNYNKHLSTRKHKNLENLERSRKKNQETKPTDYWCEFCDYTTKDSHDYNKHLLTDKHKKKTNMPKDMLHTISKEEIMMVLLQNQEFNKLILEQHQSTLTALEQTNKLVENSMINSHNTINTNTNSHNTTNTTNTNSHNTTTNNNKFNMNFFLNDQCKDAVNMSDFLNSIIIGIDDVELVGKTNYVNGITNIFMKALNKLDVYTRPIHCTDIKREVMHIKDNDIWTKETDSIKLLNCVEKIADKNRCHISYWQEANEGFKENPLYDVWMSIIHQSMNATAKSDRNNNNVIKNVLKMVHFKKEV